MRNSKIGSRSLTLACSVAMAVGMVASTAVAGEGPSPNTFMRTTGINATSTFTGVTDTLNATLPYSGGASYGFYGNQYNGWVGSQLQNNPSYTSMSWARSTNQSGIDSIRIEVSGNQPYGSVTNDLMTASGAISISTLANFKFHSFTDQYTGSGPSTFDVTDFQVSWTLTNGTVTKALTSGLDYTFAAGNWTLNYTMSGRKSTNSLFLKDQVNFVESAVPAPGAAALIGLAGVLGGRRRKA